MKEKFIRLVKSYGFNSILVRNSIYLFLLFTIVTIIPIIIAGNIGLNSIKKDMLLKNNEASGALNLTVEKLFRDTEYLSAELMLNSDIQVYLTSTDRGNIRKNYNARLADIVRLSMIGRNSYDSLYIYAPVSNTVADRNGVVGVDEFHDRECIDICNNWQNEEYVLLARKIKDKYSNVITFIKPDTNKNGFVVVNVDWYNIRKNIINTNSDIAEFYLVKNEKILYNNDFETKGNNLEIFDDLKFLIKNNKNYTDYKGVPCSINKVSSEFYDYEAISVILENDSIGKYRSVYSIIIIVIALAFLLAFVAAVMLSYSTMDEIIMFTDILDKRVTKMPIKDNEASAVASRIIRILDDNEALKTEINKRVSDYEDMKIKALQAQINSHFMNNSLGVINGEIVKSEGYDSVAGKMVVELSKILSYSFIFDEYLVPIESELVFVKRYMNMLKYRYGSVTYEIITEGNLENVKIPRMILQVLVENSIFHGRQASMDAIKIECVLKEGKLRICVEDNGDGIDEETISHIHDSFKKEDFSADKIGLKNIYKRLNLIYKEDVNMYIESEKGKFTRIVIEIVCG